MQSVINSKFRKDYETIKALESPFKEEIIRINEELRLLNFEEEIFKREFFDGMKGLWNKVIKQEKLKKEDLITKYNLTEFFKQFKKNKKMYNDYEVFNFQKNIFMTDILGLYSFIEDSLFTTTYFVEMIAEYKKSNFQINELCEKKLFDSSFYISDFLYNWTETLFMYIENPEIKELGKKMYDEYLKKEEEASKVNRKIKTLTNNIKYKITTTSSKELNLNQLIQYKNMLENINILLSNQSKEEQLDKIKMK